MFELNLESRRFHQIFLQIEPVDQQEAWEQSQAQSNSLARYNAYINRVCLKTFLKWFTGWISEESLSQPAIWPAEESLANLLEFVNGTSIHLGDTKIAIIPSETLDLEELIVPQEWVDIPEWIADYYLAIQVKLEAEEEDCSIQICGFATHQQLKYEASYDAKERKYILPVEALTESLTVMQLTLGLNWQEDVPAITALSDNETKKLLQKLGNANVYSPRLQGDITFEKWAALISNEQSRQQLYQKRMGLEQEQLVVNLSQWFHNIVDAGWQTIDEVFTSNTANLAWNFRRHSEITVERIKLIDLGVQLGNQAVALLIGLTPEENKKVGIRVQLHPASDQTYLPPNIKLALFSQSGQKLQEFTSRTQDNFIQLKRFTCPMGKEFKIQVSIGELSIIENFTLASVGEESDE